MVWTSTLYGIEPKFSIVPALVGLAGFVKFIIWTAPSLAVATKA